MNILRLFSVLFALSLPLSGCGGGGDISTDTTKPSVVSTNVSNVATYIPRDLQEIEVVFNEKMINGWSIGSDSILNWPISNATHTRWSSDFRTLYFSRDNTSALLPANSSITITLNPDGHSSSFKDSSGNTLDKYVFSFITANNSISYFTAGENGSKSSPWGNGSLSHKPAMSVKFTPPAYPVTIRSVTIYASNDSGTDQLFNLYGFDGNLASETPIFSAVQNLTIRNNGSACVARTISIPPTTITTGSFHIAVEWLTKPLNVLSGTNSFFLCTDSTINNLNTGFFRYSAATWSAVESISPTDGDLGILVNY